jgi:hypothetical protein
MDHPMGYNLLADPVHRKNNKPEADPRWEKKNKTDRYAAEENHKTDQPQKLTVDEKKLIYTYVNQSPKLIFHENIKGRSTRSDFSLHVMLYINTDLQYIGHGSSLAGKI